MAKKAKGAKDPKKVTVGVGSPLRKAFPWVEEAAQTAKDKALKEKKAQLRKNGPQLSDRKLETAWKLLRKLEPRIETLKDRCKVVRDSLAAHYGHMSVEKWEKDDETLAWPSYVLGLNQAPLEAKFDPKSWAEMSKRVLEVQLLLASITAEECARLKNANGNNMTADELRKLVKENIVVTEAPSITVAAPKVKMPIAEALSDKKVA
jgi:hypothetical protein